MPLENINLTDPNIVRENNLRLPDAITIVHGPRRLLARFLLEGDKAARQLGLHLRVRYDFDELLHLNRQDAARGNWYPITDMFNAEHAVLGANNAFWVSGENRDGEIVATFAGRLYDWRATNLAEQACAMFYGEDRGQPCIVTAEAATRISGLVIAGGVAWVRPDYRRRHLSRLIPRIGKAYACAHWSVDWIFGYVTGQHAQIGMPASYGHRHVSRSVSYPGTPWLDLAIAYSSADEVYDDISNFLDTELSAAPSSQVAADFTGAVLRTVREHSVTKISSDGVFHGSSNLS
jgi:hypothetical protein